MIPGTVSIRVFWSEAIESDYYSKCEPKRNLLEDCGDLDFRLEARAVALGLGKGSREWFWRAGGRLRHTAFQRPMSHHTLSSMSTSSSVGFTGVSDSTSLKMRRLQPPAPCSRLSLQGLWVPAGHWCLGHPERPCTDLLETEPGTQESLPLTATSTMNILKFASILGGSKVFFLFIRVTERRNRRARFSIH